MWAGIDLLLPKPNTVGPARRELPVARIHICFVAVRVSQTAEAVNSIVMGSERTKLYCRRSSPTAPTVMRLVVLMAADSRFVLSHFALGLDPSRSSDLFEVEGISQKFHVASIFSSTIELEECGSSLLSIRSIRVCRKLSG